MAPIAFRNSKSLCILGASLALFIILFFTTGNDNNNGHESSSGGGDRIDGCSEAVCHRKFKSASCVSSATTTSSCSYEDEVIKKLRREVAMLKDELQLASRKKDLSVGDETTKLNSVSSDDDEEGHKKSSTRRDNPSTANTFMVYDDTTTRTHHTPTPTGRSILTIAAFHHRDPYYILPLAKSSTTNVEPAAKTTLTDRRRSFKQISDSMRDDKSFKHRYDIPYSLYLEPFREHSAQLEMLEIGLGCDQERIGASVMLWGEFLPNARLTLLEYDEVCARKWFTRNKEKAPKGGFFLYFGDQSDPKVLQRLVHYDGQLVPTLAHREGTTAPPRDYDLIIDDGGHSMQQQIVSFRELWPRVKRGGVYVIEDLNSSYKTRYGGTRRPNCTSATGVTLVKGLLDQLHALPVPHHPGKFLEDIEFKSQFARVDCFHFVCFITKR